ncbi:MAG: hypothetical protein ACKVOK_16200 [Flavobacteriales bacterium]
MELNEKLELFIANQRRGIIIIVIAVVVFLALAITIILQHMKTKSLKSELEIRNSRLESISDSLAAFSDSLNQLTLSYKNALAKSEQKVVALDSIIDIQPGNSPFINEVLMHEVKYNKKCTVYIQYQDAFKKDAANAASALSNFPEQYIVPSSESVNTNFAKSIRYFNPEDKNLAWDIAKILKPQLGYELPVNFVEGIKAQSKQIEVWLGERKTLEFKNPGAFKKK